MTKISQETQIKSQTSTNFSKKIPISISCSLGTLKALIKNTESFSVESTLKTKTEPIYDYLDWGHSEGEVVVIGKERVYDGPKINKEEQLGFQF